MAAISTIIAGVAAATGLYSASKGATAAQEQAHDLKLQQKGEKAALATQREQALAKRKELIDKQRRQMLGAGGKGEMFQLGRTGGLGITQSSANMSETLTGVALG